MCPQIEAVGSTGKMMAGGCEPFCLWNSELTVDDIEFAIELDDFPAWVDDIKKIFQKDLSEDGAAIDRCGPCSSCSAAEPLEAGMCKPHSSSSSCTHLHTAVLLDRCI